MQIRVHESSRQKTSPDNQRTRVTLPGSQRSEVRGQTLFLKWRRKGTAVVVEGREEAKNKASSTTTGQQSCSHPTPKNAGLEMDSSSLFLRSCFSRSAAQCKRWSSGRVSLNVAAGFKVWSTAICRTCVELLEI